MLGFSRTQLRAFSKRSAQIEAELEAKGARYESPALRMRADDEASLATRTRKDHSLTPTLLQGRWREEAAAVGLIHGHRPGGGGVLEGTGHRGTQLGPGGYRCLVDPEAGLCSRSARFTRADVVEHICAVSGGRLGAEEVVTMADRFLDSGMVVRLTPDAGGGAAPAGTVVDRRPPGHGGPHPRPHGCRSLVVRSLLSKAPSWSRRWRRRRSSGRTK